MATLTRKEILEMRVQAKIAQASSEVHLVGELRKTSTSTEQCSATARRVSTEAFKPVYELLDSEEVKVIQDGR